MRRLLMKYPKEMMRQATVILIAFVITGFIFASFINAAPPQPTVSILNPKPGTLASPTVVSLRPATNDFKVQVRVWNDVAISANTVQIGYYTGATPDAGPFTWVNTTLNPNYPNAANYGVYEAWLNPAAGNYYLVARASEDGGATHGYSRDNRTGDDARYIYVSVKAANTGDGLLLRRDSSSQLCMDCHDLATHSSESTDTGYGNWQIGCLDCHTPHTTKNIYLIRETIRTPNSGSAPVDFRNTIGAAAYSYATTGPTNGICEVCHTLTTGPGGSRWRNSGNTDTHYTEAAGTSKCTSCHVHLQGFKGACDSCHNSPPATGKHATHFGTGTVNYGTTTIQSTSSAYGFSCGICHYGTHLNTLPQLPNPHTVEVIFSGVGTSGWDPDSPPPGAANYTPAAFSVDDPGKGWTFNYSDGTCTNTYCHGNYPGSGKNASPTFGAASTAPCGSCHEASNTTVPASGEHKRHASSGMTGTRYDREYACTLCHKDIVGGSGPASYTIADKSKHVSGNIDWKFDTNDSRLDGGSEAYSIATGTAVPSDGITPRLYGTCSNVYCHSNVQPNGGVGAPSSYDSPNWNSTVNCSLTCHNPSDITYFHGTTMATGSHTKHMSYGFNSYQINKCTLCHKWNTTIAGTFDGATCTNSCHSSPEKTIHVDGSVNVVFDTYFGTGSTYNGTLAPGDGYNNCSNTYCHSTGVSVSTGSIPNNTSTNWGSGVLACNACHGNPPNYSSGSPKANTHAKHSGYTCNNCHFTTTNDGSTIASKITHVNKSYDVNPGAGISFTYSFNVAGGTCNGISCHSDGRSIWTGGAASGGNAQWGSSAGCSACHGNAVYPSDYRMAGPLYDSTTAVSPGKPNAHRPHIDARNTPGGDETQCKHCHWTTTQDNTTAIAPPHVNTAYTISGGTYANGNDVSVNIAVTPGYTYSGQPSVSTCAAVSCHPTGKTTASNVSTTITWNDKSTSGYQCEDCHSIDLTTNTSYHHSMNSTTYVPNPTSESDYPTTIPQGDWSAGTNPGSRKCLMCHVKHNIFSNRMNNNGALTSPRAMNLRTAISTASTSASNYTNSDYINSGTYGICITCHNAELTKDNNASPRVKAETGSTKTVAVTGANYSASAHQYNAATTMKTGGATFNANCSKCHNAKNGEGTVTFQNVVDASRPRQFGTHDSTAKRLVSALGGTLVEDYEEQFCYRCHSYLADAIGGTKKPAANNDWYGVVTTMTAASQDTYTSMQSGTAGQPAGSTTTTNTLYFKPSAQETPAEPMPNVQSADTTSYANNTLYIRNSSQATPAEPMPNAYILNSGTYDITTYRGRLMNQTQGSAIETPTQVATANGVTAYDREGQFISDPLVSGFIWNAATAGMQLIMRNVESNAGANCNLRWAGYQWLSTDAQGTQFENTTDGAEFPIAVANTTYAITTDTAVTFASGDKVVIEAEVRENAPTGVFTCNVYWGGATENSRVVLPNSLIGNMAEFTGTAYTVAGGTWVGRSMSPFAPTAANETRETGTVAVSTGSQVWRRMSLSSPAVATATTTSAASWTINVFDRESSANANAYVRYRIYRWNANDTQGSDIVPWTTFGTGMGTAAAPGTQQIITTPTGAAVALAVGDKIVLDLEVLTLGVTVGGNYSMEYAFGSTAQSNVVMPDNIIFTYNNPGSPASGRHDVALYSGIHKPSPTDETRAYIASNKHVECNDCHNPHEAYRGNHAYSRTATAGAATSLTDGSAVGWTTDMWKGYSVRLTSGTGVAQNRQISTNTPTVLTTGPTNWTTNPANGTGYTIMLLNNTGLATAGGANTLTDGSKTGNIAWITNVWASWTVTIVSGTGAGQQRVISSNTGTALTISPNWTTNPDATSRYTIDKAPGVQVGVAGVGVTTWGGNWAGVTTYNPSLTTAALVTAQATWEVCFKCHSSANAQITGTWSSSGAAAFTDIGLEFNPNNRSGHPIVTSLNNYPNSTAPKAMTTAKMTEPWMNVGNQTMTCLDCHETNSAASKGPHGSSVKWMLAGTNKAWPYTSASSNGGSSGTFYTYNTMASGTVNGLFCLNCHVVTGIAPHNASPDHQTTACVNCHIRVPHGGKVSRLIATRNGNPGTSLPARYHPNGNGGGGAVYITSFIKPAAGYGTGNCAVTGCSSHGAIAGESW